MFAPKTKTKRIKPKINLALQALVLFFLFTNLNSSFAAGNASIYEVKFSPEELLFDKKEGFDTVNLRDCLMTREAGKPQLPYKVLQFAIEEGKELDKIEIISDKKEPLSGQFNIYPAQKSLYSENKLESISADSSIYKSLDPYPKERIQIKAKGYLGGINIVTVHVYPLEYIPAYKTLFLHTYLQLKVSQKTKSFPLVLENGSHALRKPARRSQKAKQAIYNMLKGVAANVDMFKIEEQGSSSLEAYSSKRLAAAQISNTLDYLIITSEALKAINVFKPLIDTKTARGLSVLVESIEDIEQSVPGRDTQEKIRNFIKQKYTDNGLVWLLLAGDTDIVPLRIVQVEGREPLITDMYYSCLDGDWDADANNMFGQMQDGNIDLYPDVFVGRAPIKNQSEAQTFVYKVLAYEANAHNYADKILLLGASIVNDNGTKINDLLESQYLLPAYKVTKYYQRDIPDYRDLTINAINTGQHIVNHIGHGAVDGLQTGTSWLKTQDVDALNNMSSPAILVSIFSCDPAAFDHDSFAQHWITNPNGGGVAFIGNTRTGLDPQAIEYLTPAFFESLFHKDITQIGQTLADAKIAFIADGNEYSDMRYAMLTLNLLGDPEMNIQVNGEVNAKIISPKNMSYLHGQVEISGTASLKEDFQRYDLSYAPADNPDQATLICSSTVPVEEGLLTQNGPWDTTQCPDGKYLLVLNIITKKGAIIACRDKFEITVDNINKPPEFIHLINRGAVVNRLLEFRVLASDPDDPETPWGKLQFSVDKLPSGAQFNPETQVFSWQPTEADRGTYRVTFTVKDSEYSISKSIVISTVDTEEVQITPYQTIEVWPTPLSIYEDKVIWADVRNGNYKIYMYDLSSHQETPIYSCSQFQNPPPVIDQNKIFWTERVNGNGEMQIFMYDLATGQKSSLYSLGLRHSSISDFNFRDNKVVWIEIPYGSQIEELHIYDFALQQEKIIASIPAYTWHPAIAGDRVTWMDRRNIDSNIYMYDLSLGKETKISDNPSDQLNPNIYKDKIVWQWHNIKNGIFNIYLYDCSTNKQTKISDDFSKQTNPDIFQDKIIWGSYDNGYKDIFLYDLSTGLETQITRNAFASDFKIYGDKIIWRDYRDSSDGRKAALRAVTFKLQNTVPPVITLISPKARGVYYNGTFTVEGTVNDDSSAINSVSISIDNANSVKVPIHGDRFSYAFTGVPAGLRTITVTATDDSRNEASQSVNIKVVPAPDITPPVIVHTPVTVTTPPSRYSPPIEFTAVVTDAESGVTDAAVYWSRLTRVQFRGRWGIKMWEWRWNNFYKLPMVKTGNNIYKASLSSLALRNSSVRYFISAKDKAGNSASTKTYVIR